MHLKSTFMLTACLALTVALPALAQQAGGSQGAGQQAGQGTMQHDRLHTQDRIHAPDMDRDRDRDMDMDMDRDMDKDRDRDMDRDRTHDSNSQIYGITLMTTAEVAQYRDRISTLKTLQERNQFRHTHMLQMQDRARERGVTLPGMNGQGDGSGNP